MGELRGERISKVFADGTRALHEVSFVAQPGQVLTLLGPSGCGKSTLLRIVAGLERASSGALTLDGSRFDQLAPGEREVGFVFQNYALYPHLTVARNLGLALAVRGTDPAELERRVRETAELLGIAELLGRRPAELSGGQQQRVALGRALARQPRLYLLDEPLSNLDALLRESMRSELKALFGRVGATVIYVTHDQTEAMSLSDQVAVMRAGRIRQCAAPLELYHRPAELFVATFVGSPTMNLLRGRRDGLRFLVEHQAGAEQSLELPEGLPGGPRLCAGIRPEDIEVADRELENGWSAERTQAELLGPTTLLSLRAGALEFRALAAPRDWPARLWARWPPDKIHWFDAETEVRLEPSD